MPKWELDSRISELYGFVRSRQLEGTLPGDSETGVWPITAMRVFFGWGSILHDDWPVERPRPWPPPGEPPGLDDLATQRRINHYFRVRTVRECKLALAYCGPVLASFEISDEWFTAPQGVIPPPSPCTQFSAAHSVLLVGYDDTKNQFKFVNSWGADWGDHGSGYVSYNSFEPAWDEGWFMDLEYPDFRKPRPGYLKRSWGFQRAASRFVYHCVEFTDPQDLRIAWALAVRREEGWLEVEEFFVRPTFRHQGYGKGLLRSLEKLAGELGWKLKMWISHADIDASNISIVDKLIAPIGLARRASGTRWAPMVASPMGEDKIGQPMQPPTYSRPCSRFAIR
jgi:GNAT superfamily N-acetyltransferase